jgi:hypothetical protein
MLNELLSPSTVSLIIDRAQLRCRISTTTRSFVLGKHIATPLPNGLVTGRTAALRNHLPSYIGLFPEVHIPAVDSRGEAKSAATIQYSRLKLDRPPN